MILDEILASKRAEVARARAALSPADLRGRPLYAEPRRGFLERAAREGRSVIAEIKKASPSKGLIRPDFEPARHARQYEAAGARCLSVLTDGPFFQGAREHLEQARAASGIPLLRKDFMIDPYQVVEARAWGADCILLIVAALEDARMQELAAAATEEGLDVLVEVHDEAELDRALAAGAGFVGINNRNLKTFETTLETTVRLASRVPSGVTLVSESGLGRAEDLAAMEALGVHVFLIGESLMRQSDPGQALRDLLTVPAGHQPGQAGRTRRTGQAD